MTTEAFRGSLPETILAQLTTAMKVNNVLGSSEEARRGAAPRVVWVPPKSGGRDYQPSDQQRPELHEKHVHTVSPLFLVHLWADSYTGAELLEQALERALYTVFSPNGYRLEPGGRQEGDGAGTGAARSWLFIVPVRLLRVPLPVQTYQRVTLRTATATTKLTDPRGSAPEDGPAPETTFP